MQNAKMHQRTYDPARRSAPTKAESRPHAKAAESEGSSASEAATRLEGNSASAASEAVSIEAPSLMHEAAESADGVLSECGSSRDVCAAENDGGADVNAQTHRACVLCGRSFHIHDTGSWKRHVSVCKAMGDPRGLLAASSETPVDVRGQPSARAVVDDETHQYQQVLQLRLTPSSYRHVLSAG